VGDWYYRTVVLICRHAFWVSSRVTVLHRDRVPRSGPFLLVANHVSPLDPAVLIRHTPRRLDFVSTTEVFSKPLVGWFFNGMNAFPLERSRSDPKTARVIIERLKRGRVVAMFPEGRLRKEPDSIVHGKPMRPSSARTARVAGVPLVPAVVWGTPAYTRLRSWLPIKGTRYGVIYGHPITVTDDDAGERQLAEAIQQLYRELREAMGGWFAAAAAADESPAALTAPSDRSQPV
jgi:1-acyl-sn-glycerol-3-phosphate acyltransferase